VIGGECSKATRGEEGSALWVKERGMRWRSPGWVEVLAILVKNIGKD